MTRTAIVLSKVFIVLLALAGLLAQAVFLPLQASLSASLFPEASFLHAPILTLCILFVLCGHVVLGCVWMLLSLVDRNTIFTSRAFVYVDVMIGALVVAPLLAVAAYVVIMVTAHAGPPGLVLLTLGATLGCITLALVLVVMRSLLVKASAQESYLAEVV